MRSFRVSYEGLDAKKSNLVVVAEVVDFYNLVADGSGSVSHRCTPSPPTADPSRFL